MRSSRHFPSLLQAGAAGLLLSLLSSLPAGAHQFAGGGFTYGLTHPLFGLDHLLLLVGVGATSSLDAGLLPFALAGALLGGLFGAIGGTLPAAELLAAMAVSALGLLALLELRRGRGPSRALGGTLVASAVAIHAMLHGQESHGSITWWLGAGLSSAAVVLGSGFLLRRLGPTWTLRVSLLLLLAGGGLLLVPVP